MKDLLQKFFYPQSIALIGASRTPLGQKATLSHTGSLSGEDPIYDGAFRQAGVVRASDFGEMVDLARVFISQPALNGKRIGILTTSGSLGAMAADALYQEGMELASWSRRTIENVRRVAPDWMNVKNPLDIGPSGIFPMAAEAVISDPKADGFILIPVFPHMAIEIRSRFGLDVPKILGPWQALRNRAKAKPIIAVLIGSQMWRSHVQDLCKTSIATVETPEAAARALAALYRLRPKS